MNRKFSIVGAAVGVVAFLAFALLPAMLYGGYAGLLLATGISESFAVVRILVVFGMVMGVTAIASLFTVGGALFGSIIGLLVENRKRILA